MDYFQEELASSWIEDKDGTIDWLCRQVTLKCLQAIKSIIKKDTKTKAKLLIKSMQSVCDVSKYRNDDQQMFRQALSSV